MGGEGTPGRRNGEWYTREPSFLQWDQQSRARKWGFRDGWTGGWDVESECPSSLLRQGQGGTDRFAWGNDSCDDCSICCDSQAVGMEGLRGRSESHWEATCIDPVTDNGDPD